MELQQNMPIKWMKKHTIITAIPAPIDGIILTIDNIRTTMPGTINKVDTKAFICQDEPCLTGIFLFSKFGSVMLKIIPPKAVAICWFIIIYCWYSAFDGMYWSGKLFWFGYWPYWSGGGPLKPPCIFG